jgi:hypothetical protein
LWNQSMRESVDSMSYAPAGIRADPTLKLKGMLAVALLWAEALESAMSMVEARNAIAIVGFM